MGKKVFINIGSSLLILLGTVMIVIVFYPIASYLAESKRNYPELISPIPKSEMESVFASLDYTQVSNWFADEEIVNNNLSEEIGYYSITIPELDIQKATVEINGEDLSDSLVHYRGTTLPGKKGNSVVFGHSVLPIFFDPKNYLSIFSTLPRLERGDEVFIDYDGISYKYLVENKFEVEPTELDVLDQNLSDSYLSLITCTPPGDPRKPKRLIVRARLVPYTKPNEHFRD